MACSNHLKINFQDSCFTTFRMTELCKKNPRYFNFLDSPMRFFVFAFLFGIVLLQQLKSLPSCEHVLIIIFLLILLMIWIKSILFRFIAMGMLGFLWAYSYAQISLAHHIPTNAQKIPVKLIGYIDSIPNVSNYQKSFLFFSQQMQYANKYHSLNCLIRLSTQKKRQPF